MSVEEAVLEKVTPTLLERKSILDAAEDLVAQVTKTVKDYPYDLEVRLVGSVAKDTYLKEPDIDVFIMFPTSVGREELESIGLEIGRRTIAGEERYAEHPYIHGEFRGYQTDIVPCYKVRDPSSLKSAVDRTPFHTEFVKKSLPEGRRGEARLLKQFMKGVGVYGAESRTQGFSGYLVELLIIRYGSFRKVLEAASVWRYGETL